jgi:hypothetical protein
LALTIPGYGGTPVLLCPKTLTAAHRPDVIKRLVVVDGVMENTSWMLGVQAARLAQARQIVEANRVKKEQNDPEM